MLKVYSSYFKKVLNDETNREATEEEIDLIECESQDESLWKDETCPESESFDSEEEEEEEKEEEVEKETEEEEEDDNDDSIRDWIVHDSYTYHDTAFSIQESLSESFSSDPDASEETESMCAEFKNLVLSESEDASEDQ